MSNLVDKTMELQVMTCLDSLLNRANHDEYLQRIGKKEALSFLEENSKYADIIKSNLQRLDSIDNANPSEALKQYETIYDLGLAYCEEHNPEIIRSVLETRNENIKRALIRAQEQEKENQELLQAVALFKQKLEDTDNIKVAQTMMKQLDKIVSLEKENKALKAQEPKHYLKWEDLEFGKTTHKLKAKMNGNLYRVEWYIDGMGSKVVCLDKYITNDYLIHSACIKDYNQQFFNDLRLERVEE